MPFIGLLRIRHLHSFIYRLDLIGFFNPLTKKFVPTNIDLYNLLKLMDYEAVNAQYKSTNLGFIILDEANLSPIEHYWSSFYNLTDSLAYEEAMLSINIGTQSPLEYSNNLRFISTINNDQTTEELSPRFIDRSSIIRMPESKIDLTDGVFDYLNKIDSLDFTYNDAIQLFNLHDFNSNSDVTEIVETETFVNIRKEYNKMKERFREINIFISPRIDKAFIDYYICAIKFMNPFKALDFFTAQRILPKIDGQGVSYGKCLKELKNDLENTFSSQRIEISEAINILSSIIDNGDREEYFQSYNYFFND